MCIMKRILIICFFLIASMVSVNAQYLPSGRVEIFMGAELHYRDLFWNKVYEAVVNLTPGIKWNMGDQWQLAGQALLPAYNDYGDRFKKIRLNMAVLSKGWDWNNKHYLKISGGLFGQERYGLDLKLMYPVNSWLALDAQVGVTGFCSMAVDWECSKMSRISGWLGTRFYLEKSNTEMRIRGGRFIYKDYGVIAEGMRHFKHCTVGVYAQYSNEGKENGGFKVIMMLPPYRRKARKVIVRPASNFRLTYDIQAQQYAVKMYTTDPEENEREEQFGREHNWGVNKMAPDFVIKKGGEK